MSAKKLFFLISIVLFIVFIYFSFLVSKEKFVQFDFNTTVKFQDHISRKWDLPFSLLSAIGSAEITGLIWGFFLFIAIFKRYWLTILSLPLFFLGLAIELFGKVFVLHPGPPFLFYRGVLKFDFPSNYAHTDYSYPSGHLTRTAFLVTFLIGYFYLKTSFGTKLVLQSLLLIFLILMMVSRIYLGEHWTTDVIGGTLLGSSFGILCAATIPTSKRKKEIKKTDLLTTESE